MFIISTVRCYSIFIFTLLYRENVPCSFFQFFSFVTRERRALFVTDYINDVEGTDVLHSTPDEPTTVLSMGLK